ncbi:MAG: response regulator [Synergistaceae bacterium]|jgi:signal transduction histidine kinase/CheY-like chemotaxis protein|nr:response regulator [Synergistaceae bacterium]
MTKTMYRLFYKYILSSDIPFAARIFNLLMGCAFIITTSASVVTYFISPDPPSMLVLLALELTIIIMFHLCNKYGAQKLGALIMMAAGGVLFLPAIFLISGGIESGVPTYAALVIVIMFFVLEKKECFIMVSLEIAILTGCLYINYRYFEILPQPLNTPLLRIIDNAQAIFIVSTALGMTIKFQSYVYTEEKKKAEAASKAKSEFMATMSHEIRTPLNAILGLSEIQLQKSLPAETRDDLEKIYSSGSSLLGIINDMLDISKIEAGSFELILVEYSTPSLINDAVQLNIVRIGGKRIVFDLDLDETIPTSLYGDELRVKQILNNLLSNAFKYTKEGNVTLRISWEERNGDAWLTIVVADTGIGIEKKNIGKLFLKYHQLDTKANRKIEGTGLGLSITKGLLEMMGGTIDVDSTYGKGSVFTVQLPQKIADGKPIGREVAENLKSLRFMKDRHSRGRNLVRAYMPYGRVLVVDDVATNLDVSRGLMLPYGLTIDCTLSGREAIEKIRSEMVKYDVIFMDHMMPEMDGVEATRVIRNEIGTEYAKTIPIVALTANALAGNEEMFLAKGFNAFISKPIDIMRLDMILNRWVRDRQREEMLESAERERASVAAIKNVRNDLFGRAEDAFLDKLREKEIDGLDLKSGVRRYGGEDPYMQILRSYLKHTPDLLEKLRDVSEATLPEYATTVHGLKGSSYGVHANRLGKRAEALESAAKSGDLATVNAGNEGLIEDAYRLLSDIGVLLKDNSPERDVEKIFVPFPDRTLLEKMLEASKQYDLATMEKILSQLELYEYESGAELIPWLRDQLDNLEYEVLQTKLEELMRSSLFQ